jgi:hypothetical protein
VDRSWKYINRSHGHMNVEIGTEATLFPEKEYIMGIFFAVRYLNGSHTVKRVDEVVRHPHLVTQDQFTQVSKKVSDIPEENFTINIELFRQNFICRTSSAEMDCLKSNITWARTYVIRFTFQYSTTVPHFLPYSRAH